MFTIGFLKKHVFWIIRHGYVVTDKRIGCSNIICCRNAQYCGQAMQDRLRNAASWLDLRMICDASKFQISCYHTTNKPTHDQNDHWPPKIKDDCWRMRCGQYLKSFLHQIQVYTIWFPMWLPTWLFGHTTHGFEVTIAKWSVAASGQIAKRLGFEMGNCFVRRTSHVLR